MTQNRPQKKSLSWVIFSLIIMGGGALGFYFGRSKLMGEKLTPLTGLEIIPPSAPLTAFINTDSANWQKLSQFELANSQEDWLELPPEINPENNDINYQEDIEPWLGGMMVAVLPSDKMGLNYDSVFIGGIKNKLKAKNFFDKLRGEGANQVKETKHLDITLYQITSADNTPYWLTFFDNYLVVGENEFSVQQIITTYQTKNSLAKQEKLSPEIIKKLQTNNTFIQIHLIDYREILLNIARNSVDLNENDIPETPINSAITSLNIENHGLNFRTIIDLNQPYIDIETSSNKLVKQIPDDTIFMVEGIGINKLWQEVENNQQTIPELSAGIEQIKSLLKTWLNLDLSNDVFSWLDGEFIFSLSLDEVNSFADTGVRGKLILETTNKDLAEKTIKRLENVGKSFSLFDINQTNIEGIDVTRLRSFNREIMSYGWQNNQSLLFNFSQNTNLINTSNTSNSLAENATFQLTTATLPKSNYGYLYFDLQKTANFMRDINPTIFDNLDADTEKLLKSITAVAMTSTLTNSTTSQIDINVALEKKLTN